MNIHELQKESSVTAWNNFFAVARSVYIHDVNGIQEDTTRIQHELTRESRYTYWAFVVYHDGVPIARAVGIIPPDTDAVGWIGYFECIQSAIAEGVQLITHVEQKLADNGIRRVVFPKIDNMQTGFQISKFSEPPTLYTSHNPQYYKTIARMAGYTLREKLVTFRFTRRSARFAKNVHSNVRLRTFDMEHVEDEIQKFNTFQKLVFKKHNDYVTRTLEEERELIHSMLPLIDKDLIIIAEHNNAEIIGTLICLPDYYQQKREGTIDNARIISIGVHPDYMRKGVGKHMGKKLMQTLLAKGYQTAEASWILKSNIPPQLLAKLYGATRGKSFGIFEKEL